MRLVAAAFPQSARRITLPVDVETAAQFAIETLDSFLPEARPLFAAHYAEFVSLPGVRCDPDIAKCYVLEQSQALRIFTVRVDGKLAGYSAYVVDWWLYSKYTRMASNIMLYLAPEHRSSARIRELITFANGHLKRYDVKVVYYYPQASHPALGVILGRMGAEHSEDVYSWWIA